MNVNTENWTIEERKCHSSTTFTAIILLMNKRKLLFQIELHQTFLLNSRININWNDHIRSEWIFVCNYKKNRRLLSQIDCKSSWTISFFSEPSSIKKTLTTKQTTLEQSHLFSPIDVERRIDVNQWDSVALILITEIVVSPMLPRSMWDCYEILFFYSTMLCVLILNQWRKENTQRRSWETRAKD